MSLPVQFPGLLSVWAFIQTYDWFSVSEGLYNGLTGFPLNGCNYGLCWMIKQWIRGQCKVVHVYMCAIWMNLLHVKISACYSTHIKNRYNAKWTKSTVRKSLLNIVLPWYNILISCPKTLYKNHLLRPMQLFYSVYKYKFPVVKIISRSEKSTAILRHLVFWKWIWWFSNLPVIYSEHSLMMIVMIFITPLKCWAKQQSVPWTLCVFYAVIFFVVVGLD